MGRPQKHGAHTARALLEAAEALVEEGGLEALSVRAVAARVGTSTRAVYSVFGSKEQLLVALGVRAFELLGEGVAALPLTGDPTRDLVDAGAIGFRRFASAHPWLFRIAMQHAPAWADLPREVSGAAAGALEVLLSRIQRLADAGLLRRLMVDELVCAFHALCVGLATAELRDGLPPDTSGASQASEAPEHVWRASLGALLAGAAVADPLGHAWRTCSSAGTPPSETEATA